MAAEIKEVAPESISFISSKSVEYLKSAHDEFFGPFDVLEQAKNLRLSVFEVWKDGLIMGCFALRFLHTHLGRVMDLTHLGGKDMGEWKDEFALFLRKIAEIEQVDDFTYLGRRGFDRIFPWMEEVATVYRCKKSSLSVN